MANFDPAQPYHSITVKELLFDRSVKDRLREAMGPLYMDATSRPQHGFQRASGHETLL